MECPICMERLPRNDQGRWTTECGHVFCPECLWSWLEQHSSCPLCRTQIRDILIPLHHSPRRNSTTFLNNQDPRVFVISNTENIETPLHFYNNPEEENQLVMNISNDNDNILIYRNTNDAS